MLLLLRSLDRKPGSSTAHLLLPCSATCEKRSQFAVPATSRTRVGPRLLPASTSRVDLAFMGPLQVTMAFHKEEGRRSLRRLPTLIPRFDAPSRLVAVADTRPRRRVEERNSC
jgi:hypothetical protein